MHVVMSFDSNFILPAITAIYSLFTNNSGIRLHVLHKALDSKSKFLVKRLEKCGSDNQVDFIEISDEMIEKITISTGRWRPECFFRYFAVDIFTDLDRCLWLDSDIMVRGSIEDLYNTDFEGKSFAAVKDKTSEPERRLGIREYVNSGVLLMNLKKLRETGGMSEFWKKIASKDYEGTLPDQDALNIVFLNDIHFVRDIWNAFPLTLDPHIESFLEETRIVHFVSKMKPWLTETTDYWVGCFQMYWYAEQVVGEYWNLIDKAITAVEEV